MESSKSPTGSVKRSSRNISYAKARRSTRGPLEEADDPLADPAPQSPSLASPSNAASSRPSAEFQGPISDQDVNEKPMPEVDLSFLKNLSSYQRLRKEDIPEAFLNSSNQPPLDTPLPDLLQYGHFRRAAEKSLMDLSQCRPDDAKRILQLLYTRLACLVLISRADLASVEAASLTDYLARNPPDANYLLPLIPWELRLLLVRLQSIAAADGGRRGIMALYALAAEVRSYIKDARTAETEAELTLWSDRLSDLGLRVADTLVEMGELETATRHLDSLSDTDADELAYRKALLRLRIGDTVGAKRCIDKIETQSRKIALSSLLEIANGHIEKATSEWQAHHDANPKDALFASNLAVALLYTGKISEARDVFESLSQNLPTFPGMLFNLATVYELCTEQALERKVHLTDTTAAKTPSPSSGGWERSNFEFKL